MRLWRKKKPESGRGSKRGYMSGKRAGMYLFPISAMLRVAGGVGRNLKIISRRYRLWEILVRCSGYTAIKHIPCFSSSAFFGGNSANAN